jgi:hypothetical protein
MLSVGKRLFELTMLSAAKVEAAAEIAYWSLKRQGLVEELSLNRN